MHLNARHLQHQGVLVRQALPALTHVHCPGDFTTIYNEVRGGMTRMVRTLRHAPRNMMMSKF